MRNSGDTPVRDGGGDQLSGAPGGYSGDGNSGTGGAPAYASTKGCGGVGLWGEGPSAVPNSGAGGAGGQAGQNGKNGTSGGGFGAAGYGANAGCHGGGLSFVNSVSVTPGETLTVEVGVPPQGRYGRVPARGGVNIVWGRGDFPNLDGVTVTATSIDIGNP